LNKGKLWNCVQQIRLRHFGFRKEEKNVTDTTCGVERFQDLGFEKKCESLRASRAWIPFGIAVGRVPMAVAKKKGGVLV